MKDVPGKTALVMGAASAIGRGIATALAEAEAQLMLCDIEVAPLSEAVGMLRRAGVFS